MPQVQSERFLERMEYFTTHCKTINTFTYDTERRATTIMPTVDLLLI